AAGKSAQARPGGGGTRGGCRAGDRDGCTARRHRLATGGDGAVGGGNTDLLEELVPVPAELDTDLPDGCVWRHRAAARAAAARTGTRARCRHERRSAAL